MAIIKDLKPLKVNFNLRQLKEKDLETGVNAVLRWNNQRLVLTSIERIKPKFWNEDNQTAKTKLAGYSEFNHRLTSIKSNLEKTFRSFLNDHNQYPTLEEFRILAKKAINLKAVQPLTNSKNVLKFIEQFIKDCESGVKTVKGNPMSPNSIKRYQALKNNLHDFATRQKIRELMFDHLTVSLIQELKRFLILDKKYTPGTISTRIKGLKTVLNWATRLKLNDNFDYKETGINETAQQTFEIYLNLDELEKIQTLDLTHKPRLDKVRDLFLLGCWTSLRFSDLSQINHTVIEVDKLGHKNIRIIPKKTNRELIIPILPVTQQILDKYTLPNKVIELPTISNQRFNSYIKELGKLAEIKETLKYTMVRGGKKEVIEVAKHQLIKSHTMRRSFATNLYEMGEDIKAIMDATGHTRTEVFFNYIRRTQNNSASKLRATVESTLRQRMKAVS